MARGIKSRRAVSILVAVVAIALLFVHGYSAGEASEEIQEFEQISPAYTQTVAIGTKPEEVELPESLRAVVKLSAEMDTSTFRQIQPPERLVNEEQEYDYYSYGYVAPEGYQELYSSGEIVIYTIYYAQGEEERENAYRVYGSLNDGGERWFSCDAAGNITGVVEEIPVTWESSSYDPDSEGEYTFTAEFADYRYDKSSPFAIIKVGEETAECTCGTEDENHQPGCPQHHGHGYEGDTSVDCSCEYGKNESSDQHERGCAWYSYQCNCGSTDDHHEKTCPRYTEVAEGCICGVDSTSRPWEHQEGCPYFGEIECMCTDESGEPLPEHDELNLTCPLTAKKQAEKYKILPLSIGGGGGANDAASDLLMESHASTYGNADRVHYGITIPGTWVDYINTMWMNKAYNKFAWTTSASVIDSHKGWKWSGNIAYNYGGSVINDPLQVPSPVSGVWNVYSGEQMLYAIRYAAAGETVRIRANIDLNGMNHNWIMVENVTAITIDGASGSGGSCAIYNLGITNQYGFIKNVYNSMVKNLDFYTAKMVNTSGAAGTESIGLFTVFAGSGCERVNVYDSLVFGITASAGIASRSTAHNGFNPIYNYCSVKDSYIYGDAHIGGMLAFPMWSTVDSCYVAGNLIVGTGAHSGGMISCTDYPNTVTNSFAVNKCYFSSLGGAFQGMGGGLTATDCYSSGIMEAYTQVGGFLGIADNEWGIRDVPTLLTNCYSTTLVGLRSESKDCGGFVGLYGMGASMGLVSDCYAAGEVGNYTIDVSAGSTDRKRCGGFIAWDTTNYRRCYYDKQTTAMREWSTGDGKSAPGITGLLTSTTVKGGTGMASGSDFGLGSVNWVYKTEHYPQLVPFATASRWSGAEAELVKAYSQASTSTAFLNTWDSGYDWDSNGVRTAAEVSYDRSGTTHRAGKYTYDTVREIITDFKVTNGSGWNQMISGGAPVDLDGDGVKDTTAFTISSPKGRITSPGMDWYQIEYDEGTQRGARQIRLISYMDIDAGANVSVSPGVYYDHRKDVKLLMMNNLIDNLVVDLKPSEIPDVGTWPAGVDKSPHNSRIWSVGKQGSYPNSKEYWAVPTDTVDCMLTDFPASIGAWMYTEIWRVQKDFTGGLSTDADGFVLDSDGNFVTDRSVKITGADTGPAQPDNLDEQKWNGEEPLHMDTFSKQKYIVTYFWQLEDGRYRTDSKIVTVDPGEYNLKVNVFNSHDSSGNSTALAIDAAPDFGGAPDYIVDGQLPSQTITSSTEVFGTNLTGAWEIKQAITTIDAVEIVFRNRKWTADPMGIADTFEPGTIVGSTKISGPITVGTLIPVDVDYWYPKEITDSMGIREVTTKVTLRLTYEVKQDSDGDFYLQFNKLLNVPAGEPAPSSGDDGTGAVLVNSDGSTAVIPTELYLNNIDYYTEVNIWVTEGLDLDFIKIDSEGDPLDGVEFALYTCPDQNIMGHVHSEIASNDPSCCWDVSTPVATTISGSTGTPGQVQFKRLLAGDYMLVETATVSGYRLPHGQWLVQVDGTTGTMTITGKGDMPPAFIKETAGGGEIILKLPNYKDLVMPLTGGSGPILFTIIGAGLVGAAILLILYSGKKTRKEDEKKSN